MANTNNNQITKLNGLKNNNQQQSNNNQPKIVNVNYGHEGSGQTYSYKDNTGGHKTGDAVVVPVENPKSHKIYKTLAVIRSTHGGQTVGARDTQQALDTRGIPLKTVSGGRQSQLQGYYQGWDKDAKEIARQRQTVIEMQDPKNDTYKDRKARDDLFAMLRRLRKQQIENGGKV